MNHGAHWLDFGRCSIEQMAPCATTCSSLTDFTERSGLHPLGERTGRQLPWLDPNR